VWGFNLRVDCWENTRGGEKTKRVRKTKKARKIGTSKKEVEGKGLPFLTRNMASVVTVIFRGASVPLKK